MERRIYLSDYTWTEDDYIPGQIKFIMSVPEKMGKASVRFYLNDGYTAPEEVEEEAVDTKSELYCTMIERSLMNLATPTVSAKRSRSESRKRSNACLYRRFDHAGGGSNTDQYRVLCL